MEPQTIPFLAAFIAGLLSFLSPCVLPVVPPYLGFLNGACIHTINTSPDKTSFSLRQQIFLTSSGFVLGFSTIFVLLGAGASFLGKFFLQNMVFFQALSGTIIILMGCHFLGLFRAAFFLRELRIHPHMRPHGFIGSYLFGMAFGFGWTPCIGPILATILLMASQYNTLQKGMLLLSFYALGLGIPFLLAGLFLSPFVRVLKKSTPLLPIIEKIIGGFLVLIGIAFLAGWMPILNSWAYLIAS